MLLPFCPYSSPYSITLSNILPLSIQMGTLEQATNHSGVSQQLDMTVLLPPEDSTNLSQFPELDLIEEKKDKDGVDGSDEVR